MNNKAKAFLGILGLGSVFIADQSFAVAQTFTGSVVPDGNFGGNVQVQITVDAGRITAITTPVVPTQNMSYVNMAVPTLISEALVAQSANVQGVTGASAISTAWKSSLASAIASAGSAIGVQPAPAPTTPVVTPTYTTSTTPTVLPASSGGGIITITSGSQVNCDTKTPVITNLPDVTASPVPSGTPIPSGLPVSVGTPVPVATTTSNRNTTVTTVQNKVQTVVQTLVQTITKSQSQIQVILCTVVPSPSPAITVTATPSPAATVYIDKLGPTVYVTLAPTSGIINRTIKCLKGKIVKYVKGKSPKCPAGYRKI